ncbi:MAG: type IV pilus assembly protein PilM [Pseudomonadota bacterium]
MFSSKKRGKIVGVDIGTTSIKVIEMSRSGRSLSVDRYGFEPLIPGLIIEHQIKDVEQVARAVERAVKRSGSKAKRAAVCVSSNSVISKTIPVQPDLSGEELESLVEIEADRVVPYALDEVNIDFQRVGASQTSPGEEDVQIVVCRKNVVEGLSAVLEEADLEPAVVDVDSFTLSRVYGLVRQGIVGGGQKRTSGVVDFGSNTSRLTVFHNNKSIYHREAPFGGRQLVDSIHQKYGMSQEDALSALRKNSLPKSFKSEVLKPFVKTLVQELLRTLQFFYSSSTHNNIDELLITGGCAQIGNVDKIIEKRIEVPTVVMNPFASTRIGSKIDTERFRREIPSLAIASGLALRGVES